MYQVGAAGDPGPACVSHLHAEAGLAMEEVKQMVCTWQPGMGRGRLHSNLMRCRLGVLQAGLG